MIPRLLILIALLFAGVAGGMGASWAQGMPDHGPCGMAGDAAAPECGDGAANGIADRAADGSATPCAMAAGCSGVPVAAAAAGLAPGPAQTARRAPIRLDRLPAGRPSESSLEPPIVRS